MVHAVALATGIGTHGLVALGAPTVTFAGKWLHADGAEHFPRTDSGDSRVTDDDARCLSGQDGCPDGWFSPCRVRRTGGVAGAGGRARGRGDRASWARPAQMRVASRGRFSRDDARLYAVRMVRSRSRTVSSSARPRDSRGDIDLRCELVISGFPRVCDLRRRIEGWMARARVATADFKAGAWPGWRRRALCANR